MLDLSFFSVLFKGTEKNGRNGTFLPKNGKERMECSFQKNGKERTERNVPYKRAVKNGRNGTFLSKEWRNGNILFKAFFSVFFFICFLGMKVFTWNIFPMCIKIHIE